jgi:hypothetical protein
MFPTSSRFEFGQPADDTAKKLFENAHELKLSISRGKGAYGPILFYTLEGGFDTFATKDLNLVRIAQDLLQAFGDLPKIGANEKGDDDDDDDCVN